MASGERPVSEVLRDIFGNVQEIIRSEVKLAKTELREELEKSKHAAVWLGVGAVSAFFAIAFLFLALFFALVYIVPEWVAAGLIAISLAVICAIAFNSGAGHLRKLKQIQSSATATQMKENVEWAKQQVK